MTKKELKRVVNCQQDGEGRRFQVGEEGGREGEERWVKRRRNRW